MGQKLRNRENKE